jgi:hypothetical protein
MKSDAVTLEKLDETFSKLPPIAVRMNVSWELAKKMYAVILGSRKELNSTIVEEQYALNLVNMLLTIIGQQREVTESGN